MTEHIDRDALRDAAEGQLRYGGGGDDLANGVLALLDALDQAEADNEKRGDLVLQALAVSDTWQKHAREAEARIKAVRELAFQEDEYGDWVFAREAVLRALDGDSTN